MSVVSSRILDLVDAEAEESDEDIDALLEEIGYFKASRVSTRQRAAAEKLRFSCSAGNELQSRVSLRAVMQCRDVGSLQVF